MSHFPCIGRPVVQVKDETANPKTTTGVQVDE